MHLDSILDQVIVSLSTRDHPAYWWDEEQEGYIAVDEPAQRILAGPEYLVLFRNILGGSPHTEIEVIPFDELRGGRPASYARARSSLVPPVDEIAARRRLAACELSEIAARRRFDVSVLARDRRPGAPRRI